ncbi:MAG: hypothetical protein KatS3mg071_1737 [Meiothermus sp.]|nr:MAG: hypothetical protein KatS3mg071_1737 [Meiothermus sp.]
MKTLVNNGKVQVRAVEAQALLREATEDGRYQGGKWGGLYLRAPEVYFRVLEMAGSKLVQLKEVAEVRFGIKTGANDFFYLEPLPYRPTCPLCGCVHEEALTAEEERAWRERREEPPEDTLVAVKNGMGWEGYLEYAYLAPTWRRAEELEDGLLVPPARLLAAPSSVSSRHLGAYLSEGVADGLTSRKSVRGRRSWWAIPIPPPPPIILPAGVHDAYHHWENPGPWQIDKRLYGVYPRQGVSEKALAVALGSPITQASLEYGVRMGLGGGLADLTVYEYQECRIPHPSLVPGLSTTMGEWAHKLALPEEVLKKLASALQQSITGRLGRARGGVG